jgi:hypothetical protein
MARCATKRLPSCHSMAFSYAAHRVLRRRFGNSPTGRIRRKPPTTGASTFAACDNFHTVLYHVFVGMCAASFWRGSWYIFDDLLFPNQKELSAVSSLLLGTSGMLSVQGLIHRAERWTVDICRHFRLSLHQALERYILLCCLLCVYGEVHG